MTGRRAAESELRQLRDRGPNVESNSLLSDLESEHKRLQMELKLAKNKEEAQEREKDNALSEAINLKERNSALMLTIDEKDRLVKELRGADLHRIQITRDFDIQKTMVEKLQQQLVYENFQSQNLIAEAKAATKRAEKLQRIELENEEYRSRVRQLERDVANKIDVQEGVGELKYHLEALQAQLHEKGDENESLRNQLNIMEGSTKKYYFSCDFF